MAVAAVHAAPRLARPGPALATALAGHSAALTLRKKVAPKDGPRAKVVPRGNVVPREKAGATRVAQAAGASVMAADALAPPPGFSVTGPALPKDLRQTKARLGALQYQLSKGLPVGVLRKVPRIL